MAALILNDAEVLPFQAGYPECTRRVNSFTTGLRRTMSLIIQNGGRRLAASLLYAFIIMSIFSYPVLSQQLTGDFTEYVGAIRKAIVDRVIALTVVAPEPAYSGILSSAMVVSTLARQCIATESAKGGDMPVVIAEISAGSADNIRKELVLLKNRLLAAKANLALLTHFSPDAAAEHLQSTG